MNMRVHWNRGRKSSMAVITGVAIALAGPAQAADWGPWKYLATYGNARLYVSTQWNNNMNGHNVQFRCENNYVDAIYCHYKAEAKCVNGSWVNLTGGENIYVRGMSSANNSSWRGKCADAGGVDYVSVGKFWIDN